MTDRLITLKDHRNSECLTITISAEDISNWDFNFLIQILIKARFGITSFLEMNAVCMVTPILAVSGYLSYPH